MALFIELLMYICVMQLTAKTTYEEDAFVTALTDERTYFDKKFSSVNVKNQARYVAVVAVNISIIIENR